MKFYDQFRFKLLAANSGQIIRIMRLIILILVTCLLQVSASTKAQKISLNEKNTSLETIIRKIRSQTSYYFVGNTDLIRKAHRISINVKNVSVEDALDLCFFNQPLAYSIVDKTVVIKTRTLFSLTEQFQQKIPIKGKVTDENGRSLSGASVKVEGTSLVVTTNANGEFQLDVPGRDAVLLISYVGYEVMRIKVQEGTLMNISLKPQLRDLNEVLVIGYGTKRKAEITSAIASVNVNELSANASNNVTDALQGRVAGVTIESSTGAPGATSRITIRGTGTLKQEGIGQLGPLVVIDGMPFGSLDGLNPSDIQNIEVLKDAAAASIYGSRAAGGVILVTTKLGSKNTTPKVNFNAVYSNQSIAKRMDLLHGNQWTSLFNSFNGNFPAYNGTNTNWQDEIFENAPIYKVNGDISGGSEHFQYSLSGSYLNQKGTIIKTDFNSANFRAKSLYEKGRVRIGQTIIYNKTGERALPPGGDQSHSNVLSALLMPPTVPVFNAANQPGGWGGVNSGMKNLTNPVAVLTANDFRNDNSSLTFDVFAEVRLIDQLKYKINGAISENRGFGNNYSYASNDGFTKVDNPMLNQNSGVSSSWLIEHTLNYDKKLGLHSISILAGFTAQRDTSNNFNARGSGIPVGLYSLGTATTGKDVGGSLAVVARESLIGRVSYSYDSRYMISGSIRRDGSSKFHAGYRYGVFPAVSAGWNISNEKFYANSKISTFMNSLKIRGSYGLLGNDQIPNYSTINGISNNLNFATNGGKVLGAIPSGNASPEDLRWEESKSADVGLDATFLNGKMSLTFDWFSKTASGVLLPVPIPLSLGVNGIPTVNAGTINNKGIELGLDYADVAGDFSYRIGWNMTASKNRMTAITIGSGNQEFGDIERAKVGYPIGGFFLIKTAGLFKSQAEIDAYTGGPKNRKIQPTAAPGDIKFIDFNNDGQIDNFDQQYSGSPIPTFETGLTANLAWRNFDFNLLVQGVFGNKMYNGGRIWMEQMTMYTNLSTAVLDAWTPQNSNSNFPRFILADVNKNSRENSDRWLENGAYVRVKRLELGYTLGETIAKQLNVGKIRVYLSGQNLFTFTDYSGYNPDLANDGDPLRRGRDSGGYPLQRIVSAGLNVSF